MDHQELGHLSIVYSAESRAPKSESPRELWGLHLRCSWGTGALRNHGSGLRRPFCSEARWLNS